MFFNPSQFCIRLLQIRLWFSGMREYLKPLSRTQNKFTSLQALDPGRKGLRASSCAHIDLLHPPPHLKILDPPLLLTSCYLPTRHHVSNNVLPYSDKRRQLLKVIFLVNEQNVSVMYIDINALSLCLWLKDIFQQDECFCSKLGLEEEYAKSNKKKHHFLRFGWFVTCFLLSE